MAHKHEHLPKSNKRQHEHMSAADMKSLYNQPAVIPGKEHRDDKHLARRKRVAVGAVAAIATVGGALGIGKAVSGNEEAPTNAEPTASAPANPGETAGGDPEPRTAEQVAALAPEPTELTVERYGTDGDALARAYMAQFNDWMTANASQEARDYVGESNNSWEQSIAELNEPVDDAYVEALFVSDWTERPQLRERVENLIEVHRSSVTINLMTTDSYNDEDLEPYQYGWELTDVVVESESQAEVVTSYRWEGRDNSDMNRGDTISSEGSFDGQSGGGTLTWVNEAGVWKISDHQYYAG